MTSSQHQTRSSRYQRYRQIIDCALEHGVFLIDDVKANCSTESPRFVTKVIRELEKDGWLVREDENSKTYRWNRGLGPFPVNSWMDDKIFGSQIKETPEQERPRERLLAQGADKLKTSELIAILIRSGRPGESAVAGGEKVAKAYDGRLEELPHAGRAELKEISAAIQSTAYCQIMAGIELGRRVAALSDDTVTIKIGSTGDAIKFCLRHFARLAQDAKQEEFHIVSLDTKNQVIDTHQITVGTLDASLVHPREVFRAAIKDAASSIILVHNHPSGDPTPSREDFAVTDRLTECGKTLGIDVLDHIVLGKACCVSIREQS